ncbi:MAG: hypothetical protein NZ839_02210, partial [Endomicrobia bacterium]|nr:hypothetical protein [Endomicrobiia bacterium]
VGPGFIIHGLGHFYAGKPLMGTILLVCGLIGSGLIIVGVIILSLSGALLTPGILFTIFTGIPVGISESVAGIEIGMKLVSIGSILFFGSWWLDIIGAPVSCIMRNKKIEQELQRTTTSIPLLIVKF